MTNLGTAIVTGASTGIGARYADRLARRGHDLVLVARDRARMEILATRLREETGRNVEIVVADLTDRADLARIEARLASDAAITMLVNNAGMALTGNVLDTDAGSVERLIALNITAVTLLAGAAGRAFAARKNGAIINISSVVALVPEQFDGVYSGSKAYVLNLSQSLAAVLEPQGVRVQAVLPGATRTEIWERAGQDVDSFPAEIVMAVDDLVDAALVGFDAGETVTIPPLADDGQWLAFTAARLTMAPNLSRRDVAARYREAVAA